MANSVFSLVTTLILVIILSLQRYYWRKRADDYWKSENDFKFPFGIKNLVEETLPDLRPKAKLATSLEEAEEAAAKVEKEMINQIREKAPEISKYFDGDDAPAGNGRDGLGTIAEENASEDEEQSEEVEDDEDEEDEEEDDEEEDLDDDFEDEDEEDEEVGLLSEQLSGSRSRSWEEDQEDEEDNSAEELSQDNEDLTQDDDEDDDLEIDEVRKRKIFLTFNFSGLNCMFGFFSREWRTFM